MGTHLFGMKLNITANNTQAGNSAQNAKLNLSITPLQCYLAEDLNMPHNIFTSMDNGYTCTKYVTCCEGLSKTYLDR